MPDPSVGMPEDAATGDGLAELAQAERLLASVASIRDALDVRDWAEQARVFAQQARLGTAAINHATVVKLRAERKMAEYVDAGQAAGQIADQQIGRPRGPESGRLATFDDLGLTKQRVAEARTIRDTYTDDDLVTLGETATEDDRILSRDKIVRGASWQPPAKTSGVGVSGFDVATGIPEQKATARDLMAQRWRDVLRAVIGVCNLDPADVVQVAESADLGTLRMVRRHLDEQISALEQATSRPVGAGGIRRVK